MSLSDFIGDGMDEVSKSIDKIKNLRVMQVRGVRSPHKYILLLTVADLFDANPERANEFPYTEGFESAFINNWLKFFPDTDQKQIFLEYPYYHLESDGIWTFRLKDGAEQLFQFYKETKSPNYRLTAKRIKETIEYASLSDDLLNCMRSHGSRKLIIDFLTGILQEISGNYIQRFVDPIKIKEEEHPLYILEPESNENPFVTYLNSLQNITPNSENALAESQSINPFFGYIHVESTIADYILNILNSTDKCHVILTGHAGDGKSTIGLDIYKKLKHLQLQEPLPKPLDPIEDIPTETGKIITLIKDMSELSIDERVQRLKGILETSKRYFIISNTGTLLETFQEYFGKNSPEAINFETRLLGVIDSREPENLDFSGTKFKIINLTQIDNIELAGDILRHMVNTQLWEGCKGCEYEAKCPLYKNVELMKDSFDIIRERILLVYRRMFEYGERLTLRQISAHLAYIITSGLTCERINELVIKPSSPLDTEYMFYNRFFGDNGVSQALIAHQLRAVRAISNQEFGSRPCPSVERKLWVQSEVNPMTFYSGQYGEFEELRNIGTGCSVIDNIHEENARHQIRRMLYFLEPFEEDNEGIYVRTFLNSPMILKFAEWQKLGAELGAIEKKYLRDCIMHVIKEHFSGVRLVEAASDQDIYITLNRRSWDIRQSAQIVLAKFSRDSFDIEFELEKSSLGNNRYILTLKESTSNEPLPLDLPFLDYVMMRYQGEVGYDLQVSYADRLERFKSRLIKAGQEKNKENVILVRLKTDQTFRRQTFTIKDNMLEVTNE